MKRYLFTVRPSLQGPYIDTWFKIENDDAATKSTLFAMTIRAKVNMAEGPLLIKSEDEWTPEALQSYLRRLSQTQLQKFFEECKLTKNQSL